jgi:hypothetical protein
LAPARPPKLNNASKDLSSFLHFKAHFGALLVDKGHLQLDFVQIFVSIFRTSDNTTESLANMDSFFRARNRFRECTSSPPHNWKPDGQAANAAQFVRTIHRFHSLYIRIELEK